MTYPLLCPTSCGYNFCLSCVEHLVASSKDDFQMASDGNRHVKVKLLCPQCRGNLAETISDTIMLRKAKNAEKYRDVEDSELNASELRKKHEFITLYADDVANAKARVNNFLGRKNNTEGSQGSLNLTESASKDDQHIPFIDTTLFQGLEMAMSDDEQIYLQQLLISGEPESLAAASQILDGVLQLTLQGMAPKKANTRVRTRAEERKNIEAMQLFRKRYPLPARMPKYYVINSFAYKKSTMLFHDDDWDGSIADAFSRVQIAKPKNTPGMENILSEADSTYLPPRARVKLSYVKGQAGQVGLQKGDVVTHINGEVYRGSAEELKQLISNFYQEDPTSTFQIVVNADECTAEILKLRYRKCTQSLADITRL